jgi:CRP/FNR family transcriptional regulator, anaerobic regulatory protein
MYLAREIESADVATRADRTGSVSPRPPCQTCSSKRANFCSLLFGNGAERDGARIRHRSASARRNIYHAGEPVDGAIVICEGWAVRFVQLPNGKRQILSVVLPGDLVASISILDRKFIFSVQAVTDVRYCCVPLAEIRKRLQVNPALLDLWLEAAAAEYRRADKQIVDLGQRSAEERIAALLHQMMTRSQERGELQADTFAFPLRQQQIADCTGLTPVHVCRVLGRLRKDSICDVARGMVRIIDRAELERMALLK